MSNRDASIQISAIPAARRRTRGAVFSLTLLGCVTLLSGCAVFQSRPMPRGSLIEADDYKQLKPGSSNRADALDLLGSPTARATFDDNTWIYISMMTVPAPASFPQITKQQVVVLNFDQGGTLRALRTLNLKDAKHPGMVQDATPTPGTKINVIQEILGNVGRYNPMSGMMGGNSFGGGGATGPMGSNSGPGHAGAGNTLP
ncbi:outer membrane protein assembly factor BamE [Acetobacter fallax]|uniref:Outer membrane protein assembly factor BamE n=1 Tax=Acetobacter fallax TaxID=1737473 RepID=A0ABX0KGD8_9PROT|nr:outer membrane protein assembly factor BamE [Acetobacter fallax]NHO34173.1 outer membrane protein assembly factor BamE [Acetobacter fallax]NHO37723.1 outer membrane protein assembly factor BamE [Acetobacter fallax]